MAMTKFEQRVQELTIDPCVSDWLKSALRIVSNRDPVDALNDAEYLAVLLRGRLAELTDMHINAPKV